MAVTNALSSIIVVGAMIQTVGMPAIGVDANVAFQSVNVVSILVQLLCSWQVSTFLVASL
jgi:NAD(P) transhydrogenase subunit alpha